jgi:hypothetical protein
MGGRATPRWSGRRRQASSRLTQDTCEIPPEPRTVGEHPRRARLDRRLGQKGATREIGCDTGTLLGRIYHIAFTATDSGGASCTGAVTVGVPKSQGSGPQSTSARSTTRSCRRTARAGAG